MKRKGIKFDVLAREGLQPITIDAFLTPTPGIVSHETLMPNKDQKDWSLSHHSGFLICTLDSRQDCETFATILGNICDWHDWTCNEEHGASDRIRGAYELARLRFDKIKELTKK